MNIAMNFIVSVRCLFGPCGQINVVGIAAACKYHCSFLLELGHKQFFSLLDVYLYSIDKGEESGKQVINNAGCLVMQILRSVVEIVAEDVFGSGAPHVGVYSLVAVNAHTLGSCPCKQHKLTDGVRKKVPCFTNSFAETGFPAC